MYSSIRCAAERVAGSLTLAAIAGNSIGWYCQTLRTASAETSYRNAMAPFTLFKLISLILLCAVAACANVCTPLNRPVNGPFPAIVNGIDSVDWGLARIQWTSDATSSTPATTQRIVYATAAQWAANPGVYPQKQGAQGAYVQSSSILQGSILSNLQPNTTYHVMGQSYQGGAWCSASDQTFTTPARPAGTVLPERPQTFNTTRPTITGTDWIYGSTCGTSGTVTIKVQDCFNRALPGDGIALPAGVTLPLVRIDTPNNPNAVTITCNTGTSRCTQSGIAPANGTQMHFTNPPSPVNTGVTYKVVNSSGSTFQISYDGVNPITFLNAGGSPTYYVVWPLTQSYVVVHSTAPASLLPPDGVRLGPDSLAQYSAAMPNLMATDPGGIMITHDYMASYYWYQNIIFSTDPSVALSQSGNGVDPVDFNQYMQTANTNDHIVYNQCAFAPALPPSRSHLITMDGSNIGFLNSMITGLDYWQPFRSGAGGSVTSSVLTIPTITYYWVGPGGSIGTKKTCANPGGTVTLSGGAGTGTYVVWMDPTNCGLYAQVSTGITATGSNITVSTAATPAYPTFTYTSPVGSVFIQYNVFTVGDGPISNGAFNTTGCNGGGFCDRYGLSSQNTEGGVGIHTGSGPGPFMVVNNYISGAGVMGTFLSDDLTNQNSPCGWVNPCPVQFNIGNLTEQRNTITTNPCYFSANACWNGGDYSWRNMDEVKQGKWVLQDGNIFGPYYAQISQGDCGVGHLTYTAGFLSDGFASYVDSSEWTFTNNTCQHTASGGAFTGFNFVNFPPLPMKNAYIHNNLYYDDNAYAQTSPLQPLEAVIQQSNSNPNCPYGKIMQWGGYGQNAIFDHNSIYGQGGCLTWFYDEYLTLSSGMSLTNNVFNLVSDPGVFGGVGLLTGSFYQANSTFGGDADIPDCNATQGATLFSCMTGFSWGGNVMLATWTNSFPGSQVDYTNSEIAAAAALFPGNTYFPNAGSTLNDRIHQVAWFDAPNGNLRLKSTSPYVSGAKASTDGLDVGVDMDALESAQGKVSNVHSYGTTSTSTTIGLLAPDSFGCTVDWGTSDFSTGSGSFTRVANSGGQRVQNVTLSGLPAHALIYYRVNCAVQQPRGTVKLP